MESQERLPRLMRLLSERCSSRQDYYPGKGSITLEVGSTLGRSMQAMQIHDGTADIPFVIAHLRARQALPSALCHVLANLAPVKGRGSAQPLSTNEKHVSTSSAWLFSFPNSTTAFQNARMLDLPRNTSSAGRDPSRPQSVARWNARPGFLNDHHAVRS